MAARGASSAATDVNIKLSEKRGAIFTIYAAAMCNMKVYKAMRQEFGRVEQYALAVASDRDRVLRVEPRLIAYRAALDRVRSVSERLGLRSNRRFHSFDHLFGLGKGG